MAATDRCRWPRDPGALWGHRGVPLRQRHALHGSARDWYAGRSFVMLFNHHFLFIFLPQAPKDLGDTRSIYVLVGLETSGDTGISAEEDRIRVCGISDPSAHTSFSPALRAAPVVCGPRVSGVRSFVLTADLVSPPSLCISKDGALPHCRGTCPSQRSAQARAQRDANSCSPSAQ